MKITSSLFVALALAIAGCGGDPIDPDLDAGPGVTDDAGDAPRDAGPGPTDDAGPGPVDDAGPGTTRMGAPDYATPTCSGSLACPTNDCFETASGESDNDWVDVATPLGAGDTVAGVICGDTDEDWFKVGVDIGCAVDVTLAHDATAGDLDLRLETPAEYNPALPTVYAQRSSSTSTTEDEHIRWVSRTNLPHFLRVTSTTSASATNDYTLSAVVTCPPPSLSCADDDLYGDNDRYIDALDANRSDIGDSFRDALCAGDEDWYTHDGQTADPGCFPAVIIEHDPADGDRIAVDMRVSDVTAWPTGTVDRSTAGVIVADFASAPGGAGTFVVSLVDGAPVEYVLTLTCSQLL